MISLVNNFRRVASESAFGHSQPMDYISSNQNAIIWFISPRQIPNITIRPYTYQFDGDFLKDLTSVVDNAQTQALGSLGGNYRPLAFMKGYHSANKAILPSATGLGFHGNYYSDLWTFIFMLDNPPIQGREYRASFSGRIIYSGFCLEEPVSVLFNEPAYNENCPLLITHLTRLDIRELVGPSGSGLRIQPMEDTDIVNPQVVLQSSPNRQYYLRPEDLVESSGLMNDGNSWDIPARTYIGNSSSIGHINTAAKSPKNQLSQIVSALSKTVVEGAESRYMNPSVAEVPAYMLDNSSTYECFKKNLVTRLPDRIVGINVNDQLFLSELFGKYPNLRRTAQVVRIPNLLPDSPMDDSAPNPINVMTSLLVSSIPAVMSMYGVSDVQFRYASHDPSRQAIFIGDDSSVCQVFDIMSFVPNESTDIIKIRWNSALSHLEENIFPMIVDSFGNFDVMIQYRSAGECVVQLQLPDMMSAINDGRVYNNGACGGLQSPLIGDENTRTSNITELEDAFGFATQMVSVGTGTY